MRSFSRAFPVVSSLVFAKSWYIREPHVFGGGNFLKIRGLAPSTQYLVPTSPFGKSWDDGRIWGGPRRQWPATTTTRCSGCCSQTMSWVGWVAKLAPQAHGMLLFLVGFYELRPSNCGGSQRAAKFAAMQTAPTFTLHFTLSGQVLTINYTQNLKMACKN